MKKIKIPICLGVLIFVLIGQCTYLQANITTYGFTSILPNQSEENVAIGETQLYVVVSDVLVTPVWDGDTLTSFVEGGSLGTGDILFTFFNTGPYDCPIVDIYFYDGVLLDCPSDPMAILEPDLTTLPVDNVFDVEFSEGAQPLELNTLNWLKYVSGFEMVESADADAEEPIMIDNGIGPGEWLSISFDLLDGVTFTNVCDALETDGLQDDIPDMFIALRVHFWDPDGLIDGECQFVNCTVPIPAPGAVMLGGIGTVLVGWLRRKRTL